MDEYNLERILFYQLSLFLPLELRLNENYLLQLKYVLKEDFLRVSYYKMQGDDEPTLEDSWEASFSRTFFSPVLAGHNGLKDNYAKLAAYLAFVFATWSKALITFIYSLTEYQRMQLKPDVFLPAPSSSPFYLKTYQDFEKVVKSWMKIFSDRFTKEKR